MNPWEQHTWEPKGSRVVRMEAPSNYELLCRTAWILGLQVELICECGEAVVLGLSDRYGQVLYGIDDLERASRELCLRLNREMSR